jgi:hypothetical protein
MAQRTFEPTTSAGSACLALVSLHLAACGAPPPPTTIELPPPLPAPAEAAATGVDDAPRPAAAFYLEDPALDGLEPPARWTIRQETLGSSQHCYELFYPERDLDAVAASTNAALARKGIPAKLPEPVKTAKLVGYLDTKGYPRSISPRLAPTEPLLKLILCHLAVPPVPTIDKVITHLIHLPAARELEALGKPTLAWKREYRDRRPEYGLVLPGMTREKVAAVLVPLGYVESWDESKRTVFWRRGEQAFGRMPGTELWWNAVREDAP